MKANTMVATSAPAVSFLHKISKASHGRVIKREVVSEAEEMRELFSMLKNLVPGLAPTAQISKTELLQHVIDYISELSATLEEAEQPDEDFENKEPEPEPTPIAASDAESDVSN